MGETARDASSKGKVRSSRLLGQTVRYLLRIAYLAGVKESRRQALSTPILPDGGVVEPKSLSGMER